MNKKALSSVITTMLLLIMGITIYVGIQSWYLDFTSEFQSEIKYTDYNINIQELKGDILYIRNDNLEKEILKITVDGVNCNVNQNLTSNDINLINLSSCLSSMDSGMKEIIIFLNNGIFTKYNYYEQPPIVFYSFTNLNDVALNSTFISETLLNDLFLTPVSISISGDSSAMFSLNILSSNVSEGFESDFGVWTQSTSDNWDWTRFSGSTLSGSTGPSSANEGSSYIYTESSSKSACQTYIIERALNLSGVNSADISFDYHMYFAGSPLGGTLELYVNDGSDNLVWNLSGDQGNIWHDNELVNLDDYLEKEIILKFKFTIGTNNAYQNDCALDDIVILKKEGTWLTSGTLNPGDNITLKLNSSESF